MESLKWMKRRTIVWFLIILASFGSLGIVDSYGVKFIVEPQDTIVPTGGSGILDCAARGEGTPKISWKKDGSLISFVGDTRSEEDVSYFKRSILANGSLHITSLYRTRESRPDEGMYQCFVTLDGVGSILSRSAKLQAASLARFDEEPEDISIGLGQTARFSCSGQGIPPPNVTWHKDSRPLLLDDSRMTILPSGSLEITQVQPLDEGIYNCNMTNVDKFFVSRGGRLALNRNPERDTPPLFTAVPKSQTVIATQSVVLECSAVAHPQPTITWLKDGTTIDLRTLGGRFSLIGEGNLQISNVEESDKGAYQCRAENREDSADVSASLDVHVPPRVLSSPGNFYAYEKEDVELPCKIYGKPTPTIQWFKNGDMIIEGDYFQIVNGNNLKILGCLFSDTAMYQCFGTNPSGNVQSSVHLRVLKKGEEIPVLKDEFDSLGESLPQNGVHLTNDSKNLSPPRELVAVLVSSRFVTLSWKPPINYPVKINTYAIFYKELGSDRERVLNTTQAQHEEVNVQGLQPNKRYTFRVVPYDEKHGAGQSSREISVLTQPEVDVPSQPRFLKGWPASPTRIDLRWAPPEITNGIIQKYKVYYAEASDNNENGGPVDLLHKFSTEDIDSTDELDEEDDEYLIPKNGAILSTTVTSPEAILDDLRIFTEYLIWVVAYNSNGPGANSDQLKIQTLSDSPTDTPHNVSIEPASSTSIIVRWDPPPMEFRNGIITGFKIKYKQKGRKRAETLTTDGNSRFMSLNDLERGVEYQIKISALNVNGTGPFTEWVSVATFQRDLDESQVPDKPNSLQARALADSITINWTPPLNSNVMVRGYRIGWGNGIPDVYNKLVEGKKRSFTIEKLKPNSEYVISLRASNQLGDGIPIYENVRTREPIPLEHEFEEDTRHRIAQLSPPVGLRPMVISSTSIVLSWTDTSLKSSQVITDRRFYTIRYIPTDALGIQRPKTAYKFFNSTTLNAIINDLKPNTMYEFSVRVVKNRHPSEWSLVALNKTSPSSTPETTPQQPQHTAPQDLTLVAMTSSDETSIVILNWQPPKLSKDEELKGYLVYYTTNPERKEWVEETVAEDVLTHQVMSLTPDTKYYFRMSARINKIISPFTEIKHVTTPPSKKYEFPTNKFNSKDAETKSNQMILYLLIALSLAFACASVFLCIYYRKKGVESPAKQATLKKTRKPELHPPDLWIHHDQMELKSVEKSRNPISTPVSPTARGGSMDFGDLEEKIPLHNTNSIDKSNYLPSYADPVNSNNAPSNNHATPQYHSHSLGRRKPKPFKIPCEPFFIKRENGVVGGGSMLRSGQSQSRGHLMQGENNLDGPGNKTYDSMHSGSSTTSSQNLNAIGPYGSSSDYGAQSVGSSLGTLGRRGGPGLRSFTVPIPPTGSLHHPPSQNKLNISGRPTGVGVVGITPSHNMNSNNLLQSSPIKRISASQLPICGSSLYPSKSNLGSPLNHGFPNEMSESSPSPLHKCYSTEELSQEISNLEGLMKDLNAITASEFQC